MVHDPGRCIGFRPQGIAQPASDTWVIPIITTNKDAIPDRSHPPCDSIRQQSRQISALLDREAELQERIGEIDMEERNLRIPRLKAQAETICAMSPDAHVIERSKMSAPWVDHLMQYIGERLETARRRS